METGQTKLPLSEIRFSGDDLAKMVKYYLEKEVLKPGTALEDCSISFDSDSEQFIAAFEDEEVEEENTEETPEPEPVAKPATAKGR